MFCFISLYIHVFIELIPCQFETIKLFVARFMLKFYRFEVLYLTWTFYICIKQFTHRFYWFINAGALVAYSGVAYIQQNISFEIGFLIPLISMFVSLIVFVVAKKQYVITQPGGKSKKVQEQK